MTMSSTTSAAALPLDFMTALRNKPAPQIDPRDLAKAKAAADDFEAFFVTHAFEDMFAGISSDPMFGGGEGEDVFRSFLMQEYGKKVAQSGGIGVSNMVQQQLLQLQEVSE